MLTPAGDDLEILFNVDLLVVFESLLLLLLALVDCINSLTVPSLPFIPGSTIFVMGCTPCKVIPTGRIKIFLTFKVP